MMMMMDNPKHGHGHAHSKTVRHDNGNRLDQCFPLRRPASNRKSTNSFSSSSSSRQILPSVSKGSMWAGGGGRLRSANLGLSQSTSAKWFRYGKPKIAYSVRSGSARTSPRSRCGLRRCTTCFFSSIVAHSDRNSGKRRSVKRCKFLGNVRSSQDGAEYRCKFLGRVVEGSPIIATSKSSLRGGIGPGLFHGLAMVDGTQPNLESSSHSDIEDKLSRSGSNVTWEIQSASSQSQSHSLSHSRNNKSGKESPMNEEVCSSRRLSKHVSIILKMWKEKKEMKEMVVMKDSCNMQSFRFVPYVLEEAKLESITLPPKVLVPLWMQNLNSDSTKSTSNHFGLS